MAAGCKLSLLITVIATVWKAAGSTGVEIVWEGLTFDVGHKTRLEGRREHVLYDVSGAALPGRLLAIMGPSGCGKTSLLNALAGRVPEQPGAHIYGEVSINRKPLDEVDHEKLIAYVRHTTHFYPFLTVRETLVLAARLKGVPREAAADAVTSLLRRLHLADAADTPVGDDRTPGVSDGERRRLSIGLELVGLDDAPSAILLDEPTSGLDAFNALQVVKTLRALAVEEGHTVIASIHQPRSAIFTLFDDVVLLSEGRSVYQGPAAAALEAMAEAG